MSKFKIINSEVANLYNNHSFKSEVVSQALIWENVEILDQYKNWYKICQWDDYISYIHKSFLADSNILTRYNLQDNSNWHTVTKRITKINEINNKNYNLISFGSVIPIIEKNDDIYVSIMPNSKKYLVDSNALVDYNLKINFNKIVLYALNNYGTSYFWGGKSGFGFDCSGFIQSLYRFHNINLPRDTKDQINSKKLYKILSHFKKGDLIYFHENNTVNHVAMFINNNQYIHSSGSVKINSIDKTKNDYDEILYSKILGVYRIKND